MYRKLTSVINLYHIQSMSHRILGITILMLILLVGLKHGGATKWGASLVGFLVLQPSAGYGLPVHEVS
jgi:hypothetical protein